MYFIVCLVGISQHLLICIKLACAKMRKSLLYEISSWLYVWLKSRHSKDLETVFRYKFCTAVAKIFEFEF